MKYVINQSDLIYNIGAVKNEMGDDCKIIGVLKGNGYGFGRDYMAKILLENGIDTFAVTEIEDAEQLIGGILKGKDMLMLRSTAIPDEAARIADIGAIATIGSLEAAKVFDTYCHSKGIIGRAHIKIDTGMGRYGFLPREIDDLIKVYTTCPNISFEGIYTHFAAAFTDNNRTKEQLALFNKCVAQIMNKGIDVGLMHAANSSAAFNVPESRLRAVRIGSAFTGRILGENASKLKRVGYMSVKVVDITDFPAGHKIGYNGTYTTNKETKVAILPVGHTDGWGMAPIYESFSLKDSTIKSLSNIKKQVKGNKNSVEINSQKYFTIGQIGLSHTAVDITGSDVKPGDEAKLDFSPLYVNPLIRREYIKD